MEQVDQNKLLFGFLYIIYGCMFSGKTTRLLSLIKQYESLGYNTILYSHIYDEKRSTRIVDNEKILKNYVEELNTSIIINDDIKVIGIDEAQFFNEHIQDFIDMYLSKNKIIIVSGLDGTFERKSFGCIHNMIQLSDKIEKLYADCEDCKTDPPNGIKLPAIYTIRITPNKNLVDLKDCYKPACRYHYEKFYKNK